MKLKFTSLFLNLPRFILGFTFLISGIGKLLEREDATKLVEVVSTKFRMAENLHSEIVFSTIIIELILAILLLFKQNLNITYIVSFLFVGFFTAIISYLYIQGVSVSTCGCFGAFGFSGGLETTLGRNVILLCLICTGYWIQIQNEPNPTK